VRLELAATKANLLAVRETLALAREGHELLSQKREVLLTELLHLVNDVKRVGKEANTALEEAYTSLKLVLTQTGHDGAQRLAQGCRERAEVTVRERSVMGVSVPFVQVKTIPKRPMWGLGESPVVLDEMVERFQRALVLLGERAEIETAVWRLAQELAKTQRRTNALEYLVIPQHQETLKFIQETLEERERESHFQLKRIKALGRI
jgi:V/A-type H+/Na+-transporting ATPase subunit D